jgi:hypothetical protein
MTAKSHYKKFEFDDAATGLAHALTEFDKAAKGPLQKLI